MPCKDAMPIGDVVLWCISVAAFVMSAVTWFTEFVVNRQRLTMQAITYDALPPGDGKTTELRLFYVIFGNHSRLPTSIIGIDLLVCGKAYKCAAVPVFARGKRETKNGEVIRYDETYTLGLPINLDALSSIAGYIVFEADRHTLPTDAKSATFRLHTTRGTVTKTLSLCCSVPHMQMW